LHCECRLLVMAQWQAYVEANKLASLMSAKLNATSKATKNVTIEELPPFNNEEDSDQNKEITCILPNTVETIPLSELKPIDFCPEPRIQSVELAKASPFSITVRWSTKDDESLVTGYVLKYTENVDNKPEEAPKPSISESKSLKSTLRFDVIENLKPETLYTICMEPLGQYLISSNVTEREGYLHAETKCMDVRTDPHIEKSSLPTILLIGFVVGAFLSVMVLFVVSKMGVFKEACI